MKGSVLETLSLHVLVSCRRGQLTPSALIVLLLASYANVLFQLEAFGFCGYGEAKDFVQGGNLGLGGRLPTNTHGGLMSHCHPGNPGSMYHLTECVAQLRRQAGDRQVADAEVALVHAQGGVMSSHCTLILGREV